MKTGLAIVLLLAAIFGVTVISQLTPTTKPGPGQGLAPVADEPPLAFTVSELHFDPKPDSDYHYRLFKPFFEVGTGGSDSGTRNWVNFVLRNLQPKSYWLVPISSGCPKCASARIGVMDHKDVQQFADAAAVGNYLGIGGVPNPLAAIAMAEPYSKLKWFQFDFANPKQAFNIPAATSAANPQWLFLELDYRIYSASGPTETVKYFDLEDAARAKLLQLPFKVTYAGREPFEVWPPTIAAGEFPEGTGPRTFDVFAFSMTRDLGKPLDAAVSPADPTVSIGAPVKLTDLECDRLAVRLTDEMKAPVHVASAYRYPVTVRRQADGQSPDVGSFEKRIQFAQIFISPLTRGVEITGLVTGPVKLDGETKINLGNYDAARKTVKTVMLVSERQDTELELVPDRCEPRFVKYSLGEGKVEFGLKRWPLTLTIAEQEGRSPPWKSVVVLRTKGPNPVTYRFPVEGAGR